MGIYEQLLSLCTPFPNKVFTAGELRRLLHQEHGRNPASILPSDYCYNRRNKGHRTLKWRPIFIYLNESEYRFVGPEYQYTGPIYSKPRGEAVERRVGEWKEGQWHLFPSDADSTEAP